MQPTLISIVIPTFNRARLLSVIGPDFYGRLPQVGQIVIVDDASQDDTKEAVERWAENDPRILYVGTKRHIGLPSARNLGVSQCTGTHVMFGEDDKIFDADATAILLREMDAVGADIIGCRMFQLAESVREIGDVGAKAPSGSPRLIDDRYLYFHGDVAVGETILSPFVDACFLAKREVFSKVRYDAELAYDHFREETEFQISAWEAGFRIAFTPKTNGYHLPFWMRRGGCHDARRKAGPLLENLQRVLNHHRVWSKHAAFLERIFPKRKRATAEALFLLHALAAAGYGYSKRLQNAEQPLAARLLHTLMAPAALVELLSAPQDGYGQKGLPELDAFARDLPSQARQKSAAE